ncbi:MAG: SDR family oxidoreductase [Thermoleophilaceae bacterium]
MAGLLITGSSGYLGGELARQAPGAAGTYLTNERTGAVRLDVRDADAVGRLVHELGPGAVIHTAYREAGDATAREINVDGSRNVARAAADAGARLVHVSTDLVFDGKLGRPYAEEDEPNPIIEYGRQKLDAERVVRETLPEALIVRTSLIYGGAEPSRHEQVALDAAAGKAAMKFFSDELRNPVQVGDLAAALLELASSDEAGVLHVAGADAVDRYEFARLVVAAGNGDPNALESGLAAEHPNPRPLDCRLDSSRARTRVETSLRGVRAVLGG